MLGKQLVKKGFSVSAICWRELGNDFLTELDGIELLSYPYDFTSRSSFKHMSNYLHVIPLIKRANADVYISIDCLVETYLAQKLMPKSKHVIWVQDPFDESDYKLLGSLDPQYKVNKFKFLFTSRLYSSAYKRADVIMSQAKYFTPKIERLYRVKSGTIYYLPNPLERIPNECSIRKSDEPTVCFLGRMDPQKRYWLFFELAKELPDVKFIAVGKPNLLYEKLYEQTIRKYQGLKNLETTGFIDEDKKSEVLSKSWIMCLPSVREGLPIAFLEALSHKCALLSTVNPDEIVSRFGYHVRNTDNLKAGLKTLFNNNLWKEKGESGYRYVKRNNAVSEVINKFLEIIL
jgi:glycosyltransferase involved in cell wall biosynthesis